MPGSLGGAIGSAFLAGTISSTSGHQSPHIAVRITGREVILALLLIAIVIVLLAAPIVGEAISGSVSEAAAKAAPTTFFLGLGLLCTGLAVGARLLDIVGASMVGLVILGVIVDNYLGSGSCHTRDARPSARRADLRRSTSSQEASPRQNLAKVRQPLGVASPAWKAPG